MYIFHIDSNANILTEWPFYDPPIDCELQLCSCAMAMATTATAAAATTKMRQSKQKLRSFRCAQFARVVHGRPVIRWLITRNCLHRQLHWPDKTENDWQSIENRKLIIKPRMMHISLLLHACRMSRRVCMRAQIRLLYSVSSITF